MGRTEGGVGAVLATFVASALPLLLGVQGLLGLQSLFPQSYELLQTLSAWLNLSVPQTSLVFLAAGFFWFPIGYAARMAQER
jgi:hypothetical protein